MKLWSVIFSNFWPKVISLVLAVATWFYVFDLVSNDFFLKRKETAEDVFSKYTFITKELPIKPLFSGKSPEGYRAILSKVKITPPRLAIHGPKDVVYDMKELLTDTINLNEHTRTVTLHLGLHSDRDLLQIEEKIVEVYLPVESTAPAAVPAEKESNG